MNRDSALSRACILAAAAYVFSFDAPAQDAFPSQPIELIVPFGAGGGADAMARKMVQLLEPTLGVPMSVSNIPGASGNAGLTRLLTNPPDGHTMAVLIGLTVSAWGAGIGYAKPADFAVLGVAQQSANMLFVPADSAFRSFRDLLDYAKGNSVRVATSGYGSTDDITLRYFDALGYRLTNLPFAKPQERYASLLGRRAHALYEEPGDVTALVAAKRLRALVVFDVARHPAFADVPSSKELGFDINDLSSFRMLVVRAGTPAERQRTLAAAIARAFDSAEWKKYCAETHSCARTQTAEAGRLIATFLETGRRYAREFGAGRP